MLNDVSIYAAFAAIVSVIALFVQAVVYDPRVLAVPFIGVVGARLLYFLQVPQFWAVMVMAVTAGSIVIWIAVYLIRHFSEARLVHLSAFGVLLGSTSLLIWNELFF